MTVENVTVVLRSCGERTEKLCYQILAQQVPAENIVVIHEHPFAKALDRSFEVGLDFGLPWTLCIDADVLLREGAVATLLKRMKEADEHVFEIQGKMLDKFFGGPMPAGNHLYRTSLLDRARRFVPFDDRTLRPETYVIKEMAKEGYPWLQTEDVLGSHDYEQYYKDIYRKMFVRSRKLGRHIPYLMRYCEQMAVYDDDYKVGLLGLTANLDVQSLLDAKSFATEINALLEEEGFQEKEPLNVTAIERFPDKAIENFVPSPEFLHYQATALSSGAPIHQEQ